MLSAFLEKGDLVELIQTESNIGYVHCTEHTDPKMQAHILSIHKKTATTTEIDQFIENNNISKKQMRSHKIEPGVVGMVLSSFISIDDYNAAANIEVPGCCILVGKTCVVVKNKFLKKLLSANN